MKPRRISAGLAAALNDDRRNPPILLAQQPPPARLSAAQRRTWRRLAPLVDEACREHGNPPRRSDVIGFALLVDAVAWAERDGSAELVATANAWGRQFYLQNAVGVR